MNQKSCPVLGHLGLQCMDSINKARNLLVKNTVLLLTLLGIVEVKLSLNIWRFSVTVFPSPVPPLLIQDGRGKSSPLSWSWEREFLPKSFWNAFSISILRRLMFLRQLPKSWDCYFIFFLVSQITVIVLLKLGTKWCVQSYDYISHVIPWQNKAKNNSNFI